MFSRFERNTFPRFGSQIRPWLHPWAYLIMYLHTACLMHAWYVPGASCKFCFWCDLCTIVMISFNAASESICLCTGECPCVVALLLRWTSYCVSPCISLILAQYISILSCPAGANSFQFPSVSVTTFVHSWICVCHWRNAVACHILRECLGHSDCMYRCVMSQIESERIRK